MPLLKKPTLMPVEGLDYSKPSTFINSRNGFPKNVMVERNELRKRTGSSAYGNVAISGGQIMNFGRLTLNDGTNYLYRMSKRKIEQYHAASGGWQDRTGVFSFGGGDDDLPDMVAVPEDGTLIITNFYNVVKKHTGAGNISTLGGTPPRAKFCAYLSPYLLLGYTDDGVSTKPWGISWCDTNNIENWSTGNSGSQLLSHEASSLKRIKKLNDMVAAYKEEALWIGRKVDNADVFDFEPIKTGIGLAGSRCVAEREGYHYFMSNKDFYVWNGFREEPIGASVRDEVFRKLNHNRLDRCFAFHAEYFNEIWFYIVTSGNDWPTEIWKYNYRNGFWYYDTCDEITAAIQWKKTTTETWDEDSGTWDDTPIGEVWDDGTSIENWKTIVLGDSNGLAYQKDLYGLTDVGSAIEAEHQTIDYIGEAGLEYFTRWLQFDVWVRGKGTLRVAYSTDYGDTWTTLGTISLQNTTTHHNLYFDVVAKNIRFKLYNYDSDGEFWIQNYYPFFLSRERKR